MVTVRSRFDACGFPKPRTILVGHASRMPNGRFQGQHRDRQGPDQETLGTPSLGVDQHTGEEVGQAVYWEHVCDLLVRTDDDHAASLTDHAAHVEDGGARHLLNRKWRAVWLRIESMVTRSRCSSVALSSPGGCKTRRVTCSRVAGPPTSGRNCGAEVPDHLNVRRPSPTGGVKSSTHQPSDRSACIARSDPRARDDRALAAPASVSPARTHASRGAVPRSS